MSIPIKNIYHMLSYAWNKLEESNMVHVDLDGVTTLPELFTRVLLNGTKILLRKGLDRSYAEKTQEIAGIKGKLELSPTLKSGIHFRQRTICTFDELSHNTLTNQILYSTLANLTNIESLNSKLKRELKKCLWHFVAVDRITITSKFFSLIRYHRNNNFYIFLMDVCEIVHDNTLPSEQQGKWTFIDFTRDEKKMSLVFQSFVKRFYTIKYKREYTVRGERIKWQFKGDPYSFSFVPIMNTDICLENRRSKIIIDTKFYNQTMTSNYGKERINSLNLYQLFAYLLNQETNDPKTQNCTGILLYPTTSQEYNLQLKYKNHNIFIKTINLNSHWPAIEQRLQEVIK